MRRAIVALVLLLAGGCAAPAYLSPGDEPRGAAPASSTPVPTPTGIEIPAIDASSSLIPLGLNDDGTMQVPPVTQPKQASWYSLGPKPGELGPAVIAGHVDGVVDGRKGQPGVFQRLNQLRPGDEIHVWREDGTRASFVVYSVEVFLKASFPTARVFGDVITPELRLVTCGGTFDSAARSYSSNVVAFARLA